jgi:hypothetical protein
MTVTRTFRLVAEVSSDDPSQLRAVLEEFIGGPVLPEPRGYRVEGTVLGDSARDLNRQLLTALRGVERRTRLRSAWTADGVTERFFDYASRGSRPAD